MLRYTIEARVSLCACQMSMLDSSARWYVARALLQIMVLFHCMVGDTVEVVVFCQSESFAVHLYLYVVVICVRSVADAFGFADN